MNLKNFNKTKKISDLQKTILFPLKMISVFMKGILFINIFKSFYLVTLRRRSSLMQRSTEIPIADMMFIRTRISSKMPVVTTKQSKRLNSDMK
jgi:hypothetical protein